MGIKTVIHRPRGAGKTYELARLVRESDGIMIVHNVRSSELVAEQYGLRPDQAMTVDQLRDGRRRGQPNRPIFVDNADFVLREFLRVNHISGIALSSDLVYQPVENLDLM